MDKIPTKNVLIDVVVVDIPPRYGMLLSQSWGAKLRDTLQLDFSYSTIPVFGQLRKLYREVKMKYMINSKDKPKNHPIHFVHNDLESFILYNDHSTDDLDSQIVDGEEISELSNSVQAVLNAEQRNQNSYGLQTSTLEKM